MLIYYCSQSCSFENSVGKTTLPFLIKATTHRDGWMVLLTSGYEYKMEFVNAGHLTNISFKGIMYEFKVTI